MREIDITPECLEFVGALDERSQRKFDQVLQILQDKKVIHQNFVKKIGSSSFYEMRIKSGNEFRVIIFAIDHLNFVECTKAVLLNGFQKKSNKDYTKAIKKADRLLQDYLNEN